MKMTIANEILKNLSGFYFSPHNAVEGPLANVFYAGSNIKTCFEAQLISDGLWSFGDSNELGLVLHKIE